jgi:ADP-dependent NAD(P)H-hydrate dehydratase
MNMVTAELLRSLPLPQHNQGDNKEGRGQVMIVGGCLAVPGAILLSAEGALRAGAGKLQIATCHSIAPQLGLMMPEAMVIGLPETPEGGIADDAGRSMAGHASQADAVLIGPGMIGAESVAGLVTELLEAAGEQTAFVFDAGALNGLSDCQAQLQKPGRAAVITPHAGEMAKLLDVSREAIVADPLRYARQAAAQLGCIVVLKGGKTYVVEPSGEPWMFDGGTIGLATSGSGDVLAGIIAGLLARGTPALHAAVWGVYLHAEAGRRLTGRYGGIGLLARELPAEIPGIMAST